MNHTSTDKNIAKKYAQAFWNVFPKSCPVGTIAKIEAAQKFLQTHKRTLFFLQLPQFSREKKESMVADLVGHFHLPSVFSPLLLLLTTHNRAFYIPDVLWFIIQLYKERTHSVDFSLISAQHLEEKQVESIKQFLGHLTKKNIIATPIIDPSLIAGIRLQSNHHIWEYSVRKHIKSLRALK